MNTENLKRCVVLFIVPSFHPGIHTIISYLALNVYKKEVHESISNPGYHLADTIFPLLF